MEKFPTEKLVHDQITSRWIFGRIMIGKTILDVLEFADDLYLFRKNEEPII